MHVLHLNFIPSHVAILNGLNLAVKISTKNFVLA